MEADGRQALYEMSTCQSKGGFARITPAYAPDTLLIISVSEIRIQCNLDYPDLVYPEPQLSGLA